MTAERKNAPLPELMVWEMPSGTVHICTRKSPHCIIATLPRKGSAAGVSADLEDVAFGDGIVEAVNQHAALSAEVERLRGALFKIMNGLPNYTQERTGLLGWILDETGPDDVGGFREADFHEVVESIQAQAQQALASEGQREGSP